MNTTRAIALLMILSGSTALGQLRPIATLTLTTRTNPRALYAFTQGGVSGAFSGLPQLPSAKNMAIAAAVVGGGYLTFRLLNHSLSRFFARPQPSTGSTK